MLFIVLSKADTYIAFCRYHQNDVTLIKIARKKGWKLGKDIGFLSYNNTSVKEVLENGITVTSTDFNKMGEEMAKAILKKEVVKMRDLPRLFQETRFRVDVDYTN